MKNKLQPKKISLSAAYTYGLLKAPQQNIDPYTRTLLGLVAGFGMSLSENNVTRSVGFGIMLAGVLQSLDTFNGGKLSFNNGTKTIYVLYDENGISQIVPGELPKNSIDGFTFKGLNGIFKLSDGVYAGIDSKNKIKYSFGIGKYVNQMRSAGLKNQLWIANQKDLRWAALYQKSIG